jgi:hypothetical protein
MTEAVAVAVITGAFGVVGVMVRNLSRSNAREHQENGGKLDRIIEATENLKNGHTRIEGKIDNHIGDHARGDV